MHAVNCLRLLADFMIASILTKCFVHGQSCLSFCWIEKLRGTSYSQILSDHCAVLAEI